MNKFIVYPCFEQSDEDSYQGTVVSMANSLNPSFMLFFPIAQEYSKIINTILKNEEPSKSDFHILSIYQTMINSWEAGDRYISGIIMDIQYDDALEEEIISPTLIICDEIGNVDSILKVNFVHSIILAAMTKKELLVTDDLLHNLLPDQDSEESGDDTDGATLEKSFPIDKQILDIAKEIMTGKNKTEGDDSSGD